MIGEPRTIARIVEFFHIPLQHSVDTLREVYQAVSGSCGYDNFIRVSGGAKLESATGEGGLAPPGTIVLMGSLTTGAAGLSVTGPAKFWAGGASGVPSSA